MFSNELRGTPCELSAERQNGLREVCIFILLFYVQCWFKATDAVAAPRTNLELVKQHLLHRTVNKEVANSALNKLLGHLWYLSEELVPLSLFDPAVPLSVKGKLAKNMKVKEG